MISFPVQTIAQSMQPPLCPGHREASVIRTVKKGGENQGEAPFDGKQHVHSYKKLSGAARLLALQCYCEAYTVIHMLFAARLWPRLQYAALTVCRAAVLCVRAC